jgi:hypothetical protein
MNILQKRTVGALWKFRPQPTVASIRNLGGKQEETYTEKQAKKGRPVSPHVTIYKFPVTALSSITNRVTGVILSVGKNVFNKMKILFS